MDSNRRDTMYKLCMPYVREEELGARLGQTLQDIHIPDDVLAQLQKSLGDAEKNLHQDKKQHADASRASQIAEIGTLELQDRWRKSFPHTQKAL